MYVEIYSCVQKKKKLNSQTFHLLSIHYREKKAYIHSKIYTQIFITALFLVAKNWKQPFNKWNINKKEWTIHTYKHMDESQNSYSEQTKPGKKNSTYLIVKYVL